MIEYSDWELEERAETLAYNKERVDNEFFIDLQGKVVKLNINDPNIDLCESICSMHNEICEQVLPNHKDAETKLMNDGWVMVGSSVYNSPVAKKAPNGLQIQTLMDLKKYDRLCVYKNGYYINYSKNILDFDSNL